VLIIADNDTDDHTIYAVIQGGLLYEAQSVMHAVDICLKATVVFGLSFPLPARSACLHGLTCRKLLFGLSSSVDYENIQLGELISVSMVSRLLIIFLWTICLI
jgi:hypothetical protein